MIAHRMNVARCSGAIAAVLRLEPGCQQRHDRLARILLRRVAVDRISHEYDGATWISSQRAILVLMVCYGCVYARLLM